MKTKIIATTIICSIVLASCQSTEDSAALKNEGMATLQISLIDDPAMYDAVLIDVIGLEYRLEAEDESSDELNDNDAEDEAGGKWVAVDLEPMLYDLLELNNGTDAILADIEIEVGELKEVRLILGEGNLLVIEGDSTSLTVPSGASSGLKVKIDGEIEDGANYKLVLDFDAAKSIVKAGNSGKYNLKPVIRVILVEAEEETYGSISGVVAPDTISSIVYVIDDEEDSVSTMPEENGTFLLELLEEGFYTVSAVPQEGGFSTATLSDVEVMKGMTVAIDTLKFN